MTFKSVQMPLDAGLAALLRWPGLKANYRLGAILGVLSNAAHPRDQTTHVQIPAAYVPVVADHLSALLVHAREVSDPAADVLAGVLAREFGVTVPARAV